MLHLENATTINQDFVQASFSGDLSLLGDLKTGHLAGSLDAHEAIFTIPDQASAMLNTVDVTFINQPNNETIPQAQALDISSNEWPLTFDIAVNFPKNLRIEGNFLTSIWQGKLNLQGSDILPMIFGEIKVDHGQYLFNGKPFKINQGNITFAGEPANKTSLYIIANRDLDEVEIDIILKGPIKNPSISFRSNPPLPQREIISWLLFNQGTSEISSFQGSQLSESITNLDSNQQSTDVMTKIRNTLHIDRLDISRTGTGNDSQMNFKVGKYISDDVLLSINRSTVNRLAIEAALTKRVKLQAEVGDDAQGIMLLKWKKDY